MIIYEFRIGLRRTTLHIFISLASFSSVSFVVSNDILTAQNQDEIDPHSEQHTEGSSEGPLPMQKIV